MILEAQEVKLLVAVSLIKVDAASQTGLLHPLAECLGAGCEQEHIHLVVRAEVEDTSSQSKITG